MSSSRKFCCSIFICFLFPYVGQSAYYDFNVITPMDDDGDASKPVPQLVRENGFNFETHKVTTEDGYILTLWRIYQKKSGRPLILQHGVLDNSFSFLLSGSKKSPAYYFAKEGYDVWIPNNRGQTHSLEHVDGYRWYFPFSKFWDFSFHEMGLYDFPAIVKYVKKTTAYPKVTFVGHSQGTTTYFIKAISDPKFVNENINAFIALGPAIFINPQNSEVVNLIANRIPLFDWMYSLGMSYFWVLPEWMLGLTETFCRNFPQLYYGLIPSISGATKGKNFDLRRWPSLCTKMPGGTSTRNLLHWLQLIRSRGKFLMFDYGTKKNMEMYGQESPKEYDVSKLKELTVPSLIVSGTNDALITEETALKVVQILKNGRKDQVLRTMVLDDYAHMDFIWGVDAVERLYPDIDKFIKRCLKGNVF